MIPLHKVLMDEDAWKLVACILESGWIGQGKQVDWFEEELQSQLKLPRPPIMTNSCTSALDLALDLIGVTAGDQVISTPMTCIATNMVLHNRGAQIVWADVNALTGLIDPDVVSKAITPRTKAIMAVDWAGRSCDYRRLRELGIPIIQDSAHRLERFDGDNQGHYVCWSFQSIKFLTTGDGGALLCPPQKQEEARLKRWFGMTRGKLIDEQTPVIHGYKYAPNDVAASIGRSNLYRALHAVFTQKENAKQLFNGLIGRAGIKIPTYDQKSSYWLFTLLVDDPGDFVRHMASQKIHCGRVHVRNDFFPVFGCHSQVPANLPGVDYFDSHQVNVPVGWWLTKDDLELVIQAVKLYWKG